MPLFTGVRGRGILRSPCPESCIAPALTGQNHLTRPPLLDRGYPHIVAVDRYAQGVIDHAVSSRRAHGLATRDPRSARGVGAAAPPAGGAEAPRQKARQSRGRAPGGGA